jgi:hypothetical protein
MKSTTSEMGKTAILYLDYSKLCDSHILEFGYLGK